MRSQPKQENRRARGALAALVASRYWRAAEAQRVVAAWERSGETGAGFARRHGVSVRRLLRWRERLRGCATPLFHPVRVIASTEPAGTRVAPLELELRGGRRIRVHSGFDPELLAALVRTVEGIGC